MRGIRGAFYRTLCARQAGESSPLVEIRAVQNPLLIILVTKDWYFLSHRLPLARSLRQAGFRVAVAAHDTGRAKEILAHGFEFYNVDFDRKSINPLKELLTLRQIYGLYQVLKPQVVHHIAIKGALYGGLAARMASVPYVFNTIAGLGYLFSPNSLLPGVLRLLVSPLFKISGARPNSSYIFFNQVDRETFVRCGFTSSDKSCVVPGSGVDLSVFRYRNEPSTKLTFVCACRLLEDKGIRELIEAARKLRAAGLDFRLIVAGTPDSSNRRSIAASEINAWKREGIAEFPGFVDDIASLLAQSHVAVLPSYYPEGIPLFLIEAAACGRASITCQTQGCSDVVIDGETGLVVPARDAEALAQAMRLLIEDPNLRRQMGLKARQNCEANHSIESVGAATLSFYRARIGKDTEIIIPDLASQHSLSQQSH
ncbi:MAG: glycosyltransferase family 4 protein [Oligoflexia bacterium]|nr:glycosyltransferase family 4 protein [Oligoflexia bacterium]